MSILHYRLKPQETNESLSNDQVDNRYSRDALGDLKHGLDLIFDLKNEIDKLHPVASETLIRLLSH